MRRDDGQPGIGAACAIAFGACGDGVAIGCHADTGAAEASAGAVRDAGGEAVAVKADVADEASVDAAFAAVGRARGPTGRSIARPMAVGGCSTNMPPPQRRGSGWRSGAT